jgi:hypothetical protein
MASIRRYQVPARYLAGVGAASFALLAGCGTAGRPTGQPVMPGTQSPAATSPTALGSDLVRHYFRMLESRDDAGLRQFLSPSFHAGGANGTTVGRAAYLANLPDVRSFTVSNVNGREYLGVLVVTYRLRLVERVGGASHQVGPERRLTVFAWQHGAWRLAAHAYLRSSDPNG